MKILFLTILLSLFSSYVTTGQKLDRKSIEEKFEFENKENILYVVNGMPIYPTKLDSILNSYPSDHLVEIIKLEENHILCSTKEVVLIVFAYQQKSEIIRKTLKDVKKKYLDNFKEDSEYYMSQITFPILYMDNKLIPHFEIKEKLKKLKVRDIYYINYKSEFPNSEINGKNKNNGILKLWIKNSSKEKNN